VYYRGLDECSHSAWTTDASALACAMGRIICMSGPTQILRVLEHVRSEHAREPVAAAILVGDAVEEPPGALYDAAAGLPPLFLFQEGSSPMVRTASSMPARRISWPSCCGRSPRSRPVG
jgi:hypothetical protein